MAELTYYINEFLARPAIVSARLRWVGALFLFIMPMTVRLAVGPLHGANPSLAFYPAILIAAVLLGWQAALCILVASAAAGTYWFLPPDLYLLPIAWMAVGGLNILIISLLRKFAKELGAANKRQLLLFQELQQRVANSMNAASETLETARKGINAAPADADALLQEAVRRIAALAEVHRRLNDPKLFGGPLGDIFRDAVSSVIDGNNIVLALNIEDVELSFDQMSLLIMLVLEVANNAQKHVFRLGKGSIFYLSLRAVSDERAVLVAADDGPGIPALPDRPPKGLGLKIMRGLADQLGGTLTMAPGEGTEVFVEFPRIAHQPKPD